SPTPNTPTKHKHTKHSHLKNTKHQPNATTPYTNTPNTHMSNTHTPNMSNTHTPNTHTPNTFYIFTLMAHCTSGAIRGSVSCSRTLRQGIEVATFLLLNDFSTTVPLSTSGQSAPHASPLPDTLPVHTHSFHTHTRIHTCIHTHTHTCTHRNTQNHTQCVKPYHMTEVSVVKRRVSWQLHQRQGNTASVMVTQPASWLHHEHHGYIQRLIIASTSR